MDKLTHRVSQGEPFVPYIVFNPNIHELKAIVTSIESEACTLLKHSGDSLLFITVNESVMHARWDMDN